MWCGRLGEPELPLRIVDVAQPEQEQAEVEADARILRVRACERPEAGEGLRGVGLVETDDCGGDLRLDRFRIGSERGVVLAPGRERPAEPLQRDAEDELLRGAAADGVAAEAVELLLRRQSVQVRR